MKKWVLLLCLGCLLIPNTIYALESGEAGSGQTTTDQTQQTEPAANTNTEIVTLEKCVDGDTAKFLSSDGSITSYRFLAVDTPETVHPTKGVEPYGKEASDFTCNALTNAKEIKLEFDDNAGKVDKYDRGLAWVFVDGQLLQEQLISKGLAEVAYLYDDYKYTGLLQDAEAVAKANKVGLWSEDSSITEESKTEEVNQEEEEDAKEEKGIFAFFNRVLEAITASLNDLVDSILQMIEDML